MAASAGLARGREEGRPEAGPRRHLFVVGEDYHLGDLLWLTAVLAQYRWQRAPELLAVSCPDRPISRILEHNPLIDELRYHGRGGGPAAVLGSGVVHDLRPLALAGAMLRDWRRRAPWLYFRDLWLGVRGQWLATWLGLGRLRSVRPVLGLREPDRRLAKTLPERYVLLAPRIGEYRLPLAGQVWASLKRWPEGRWIALARRLRRAGYEPLTLAAAGQEAIAGTTALVGLPIRQVAGIVEQAAALVSVESGLWYLAAASATPFLIVPWWLPRSVDWPAPMHVPYALAKREASAHSVFSQLRELLGDVTD